MKLIPWLYTAYYNYYENGVPPVRPLVLDYPEDTTARGIYDEYLLGDGLLAAPVIFGQGALRRIWLPEGGWYEYDTGAYLEGSQWIERVTEPGDIPMFVREGTLLAMAEPEQHVGEDTCFRLQLTAYGGGTCSVTLIADDGVSNDYRSGVKKVRFLATEHGLAQEETNERYCVVGFERIE